MSYQSALTGTLLSFIFYLGNVSLALAQDNLSSEIIQSENQSSVADIVTIPAAAPDGRNGRDGYYTCPNMTWGIACAKIGYSFPTPTLRSPGDGSAPATSGSVTNVTSSDAAVVQIDDYNPSAPSGLVNQPKTIVVTQVYERISTSSLSTADVVLPTTDTVNAGELFIIKGAIDNGKNEAGDDVPDTLFEVTIPARNDNSVPPESDPYTIQEIIDYFNNNVTYTNVNSGAGGGSG